ncbi:DoxX family protein [Pedobacter nutrimenti]|uniref:Putative membrane protein YphA (DoxX/SURF4 family) n=1 Tax=Pedobacter nutrimenti TaxID=1241337 RepID=A0A318U7I0_9SPHI|nr:DoxX family protein [Pedobacter nutrimenti]PYF69954.1 putative membrane protein YphA (DoxX/SURF4 family) [Pedobacter nutrimenti]|eukprot:gene12676-14885_t
MNVIHKIEQWGDVHRAKWLDIVRIALGLLIFFKGIALISNTAASQDLLLEHNVFGFSGMMASLAIHIVAFVHLVGGILITIGLVTRFAVVIQIPILLCAIFFVNISKGFSMLNSELWLSVLVLLLLILFWVVGSGPFSADQSMKRKTR